tara:strand:- start:118 stop:249 length:132 start_codon:yes stop_codon:yes gene_type:complete
MGQKEVKEMKKVTFFMVTLDSFLKFINSPGGSEYSLKTIHESF